MAARATSGRRTGGTTTRRRRAAIAHESHDGGAERWMVTYADMLTLLLVLFIVLFSISVVNTSKFISLKTSLASAFGSGQTDVLSGGNGLNENAADGQGQAPIMPGLPVANVAATPQPDQPKTELNNYPKDLTAEVENFKRIEEAINASLRQRGLSGAVRFAIDRRGLVITVVTNDLVFPGNSATLLAGGQRILGAVAPPLVNISNKIEVDGFTNQENVSTYPYPTGWELSSARASSVVRYLVSANVGESRLSAVGFSDQRPLYAPSDPRAVTLNRRVEIVVLTSLSADTAALLPVAAGN